MRKRTVHEPRDGDGESLEDFMLNYDPSTVRDPMDALFDELLTMNKEPENLLDIVESVRKDERPRED